MHVGLIIYGSIDQVSGGYLYDRELVAHLRGRGDHVEVISQEQRSYPECLLHNADAALLRRLARARFDVLLEDELNHPSLAGLNRLLRPWVSYPIVSIVHHLRSSERRPAWQNRIYGLVERAYLRSVDACVFNSETTRDVVQRVSGLAHPSVVAYPAGDRLRPDIDAGAIAARARASGPLRVLFVGNLIERKGMDVLLDALGRLPEGAWHLTVVGREPEGPGPLQDRVRRAAGGGQVTFTGRLSDGELLRAYLDAQVLAVPSYYEGFGIVYLEGMGAGLPAIGTTAGAAHEIITDGVDGFLVPAGDAGVLAARLGLLARDRGVLADMGVRARERYLRHPTWQQSAARTRAFLVGLCGGRG